MPIMSVTSPRMAARTATAFRRERDGPTTGFDDPPLRDASRSAGSTTRRDLRWDGGKRGVTVSHLFIYSACGPHGASIGVKATVVGPNDQG